MNIVPYDVSGSVYTSPVGAFPYNGMGMRIGATLVPFRYGWGANAYFPQGTCECVAGTMAFLGGGELFMGYAPGGFWSMRPFIEVRAHAERLTVGDRQMLVWGVGPRLGVLMPLSEYFFVDAGLSI